MEKHGAQDAAVPVAAYVRMSTDHQRYSTENQLDVIEAYAAAHGMTIIKTYRDEGKSGLDFEGRESLKQLIQDVEAKRTPFRMVLVYDVSRWGRFQNTDESAHYEYLCTRAGVRIVYCAEPFDNDGSPLATIYKGIKRSMAGEYSRELSNKVFAGQCRLVKLGFHQGGPAGFGLRRALQDEHKTWKGELARGQQKSIQTDRVILVPGPPQEVAVVRGIYQQFLEGGLQEQAIADELNAQGWKTDADRPWTRGTVHQILTNEKYVGHNVYNRTSSKLRQRTVRNAPEDWVRCDGAFEAVVPAEWFEQAQARIARRTQRFDDAQMLAMLRNLFERTGTLSGLIIDEQEGMPSSTAYGYRFGGLVRAYALVGFTPDRDYRYLAINRALRQWRPQLIDSVMSHMAGVGAALTQHPDTDLITVNGEWTLSVVLARCRATAADSLRWHIRFDTSLSPDLTLAVRLDRSNLRALDYYLVPRLDMDAWPQRLMEDNSALVDSFRDTTLNRLGALAARTTLKEAA